MNGKKLIDVRKEPFNILGPEDTPFRNGLYEALRTEKKQKNKRAKTKSDRW
jgi:hypothetical protein